MKVAPKILMLFPLLVLFSSGARGQTDSFAKNFNHYRNVATDIDFFAGNPSQLVPFQKPVRETRQRLENLLGRSLTRGAIIICSTLEQMDAQNDRRMLKAGYKWVVTQLTPEAMVQQERAQFKAQGGVQLPPDSMERPRGPVPEMTGIGDARMIDATMKRVAFAIVSTTLSPEKEFRSSRLDDMGRSPLPDWLDVGLTFYAAGPGTIDYRYLQDHLEEVFPLEDLLSMPRPFVAPTDAGMSGGPQFAVRIIGQGMARGEGPTQNGSPTQQAATAGSGGDVAMGGLQLAGPMAKDVQDRLTFDSQAASFFSYLMEKIGADKVREVIEWNREGKLSREALVRPGYLGPDLDKAEEDWQAWVKGQKAGPTPGMRIISGARKPGDF